MIKATIDSKLRNAFAPSFLDVINESHMHAVPPNSQTHFKVVLVSAAFEGVRAVKRHQQVYSVLADELAGGVHALSLSLHSPAEWQANSAVIPSPDCMGKRTESI